MKPIRDTASDVAPYGRIPAVVLGGGVTGADVLRCLHLAGIPSVLATARGDIARPSRLPRQQMIIEEAHPSEMMADVARRIPGDAVLIPCSDRWAQAVTFSEDVGHSGLRTSTPDRAAIEVLTDKLRFSQLLNTIDVPHPLTRQLTHADDLDDMSDDQLLDAFLKPVDSEAMVKAFRRKAFRIESRAQARKAFATADAAGVALMLQQFIAGPPRGHVFLDGFIDQRRRWSVVLARRRLRLQPLRYGNSTLTEVIPLHAIERARERLRRVFDALAFNGPFCAEFVYDPAVDDHLLIEINGRCWWQIGLTAACGANVPERIYLDALGEETCPVEVDAVGTRWAYPFADIRSWTRAMLTGVQVEGGPPPFAWRGGWLAMTSLVDPAPGAMVWLDAGAELIRRGIGAVGGKRRTTTLR